MRVVRFPFTQGTRTLASAREIRDAHAVLSDARGVRDAVVTWGALALVIAVAHAAAHPLVYFAAAAVIGGLQHALVNLAHEAWHRLCFRSRAFNDAVGAWLYSYPIGVPFHHDRARHLRHHRRVGAPDDPDFVNYTNRGRVPPARLYAYLAGRLLGSQLLATAKSVLVDRQPRIALEDASGEASESAARGELLRIAVVQLGLLGAFAAGGRWWEYFVLWLGPLATFAAFYVAVRAFVEHAAPTDEVAVAERLNDFSPGPVERFLISPVDFHHHALHHAHPGVPHFRLAALRDALDAAGERWPGARRGGYVTALREHVARVRAGGGA